MVRHEEAVIQPLGDPAPSNSTDHTGMTKDEQGRTPLMQASFNGQLGMVQRLLGVSGAEGLAERDVKGWSALHCAAHEGHEDVLTLLLSHGADFNCKNNDGCTPLMHASSGGHLGVAQRLLEVVGEQGLAEPDENKRTAIHYAANSGHEEMVALLLSHGVQANSTDKRGMTPFMHASSGGHLGVAQRLLEVVGKQGLAEPDENKLTAMHYAAYSGHEEMVALLLSHGVQASSTDKRGQTPLMHASSGGHLGVAQRLLMVVGEQGLAEQAEDGTTALECAAQKGHGEMVALLLSHGVQASSTDKTGMTPLMHASSGGHVGVAQRLMPVVGSTGLAERDEDGMTALYHAAFRGCEEVVRFLHSMGAQVDITDRVFEWLIAGAPDNYLGAAKLLIRHVGKQALQESTEDGETVLHWACQRDYAEDLVRAVLLAGADPSLTDNQGRTPRAQVVLRGHIRLVAVFDWWEAELERAHLLQRAKCLHDTYTRHQTAAAAPVPAYLTARAAARLPLPRVEVAAATQQEAQPGGASEASVEASAAEARGTQEGKEERHAVLNYVLTALNDQLFIELMDGFHAA